RMAPLDEQALAAYLASGEWEGKAGAYAIQGRASGFARVVEGRTDTVIGMSLELVAQLLDQLAEDA
ncbi:MAG: Maf-like protein, partial [Planctomycetes bacterium]|nr:Maf-like protein [Planctomycetota bacterium]